MANLCAITSAQRRGSGHCGRRHFWRLGEEREEEGDRGGGGVTFVKYLPARLNIHVHKIHLSGICGVFRLAVLYLLH